MNKYSADVGLPELKQIAKYEQLRLAIGDIIEKKIELVGLAVHGKIVPRTAIPDMQITYNNDISFGTQWLPFLSVDLMGASYPFMQSM